MFHIVILCKLFVNVFSVTLHVILLLTIICTPSLKCGGFDELFYSQNMGDVVAVILRVITKFVPILVLRNHTGVIQVDRDSFPLATLTNAAEWYTNYVIILSALVFGADRAVMAVSIKSYTWSCNRVFKICLVVLTWLVPLVWVLPMLDPCCRSQYFDERIDLVGMERHEFRCIFDKITSFRIFLGADSIYDAIDMLFETLFYVPVLCMLNSFTMITLYSQYNTMKKRHDLKFNLEQYRLPTVEEVYIRCMDPGPVTFISFKQDKEKREHRMLQRLDVELSFAMIAIIDQQIDFFAVLFYTLYWASYSHFIDIDGTIFLESYSILFEFGNIISPYILLCFFPDIRKEVFRHFRPHCRSHEDDVEEGWNGATEG